MKKNVLRGLFLILILAGCGKSSSPSVQDGAFHNETKKVEPVSMDLFKNVVRLKIAGPKSGYCTGVVVSEKVIATAANCVTYLPERSLVRIQLEWQTEILEADGILVHPEYFGPSSFLTERNATPFILTSADIALVHFAKALLLPISKLATVLPNTSQPLTAVGYESNALANSARVARQGILNFAGTLPLVLRDDAGVSANFGSLGFVSTSPHHVFCSVDSGAAIFIDGLLLGIHSGGTGLCATRASSTGISIPFFGKWITDGLKKLESPWTNPILTLDVNNDGFISPIDALLIIERLNGPIGPGRLQVDLSQTQSRFYDTDKNGLVTVDDARAVIRFLEERNSRENL